MIYKMGAIALYSIILVEDEPIQREILKTIIVSTYDSIKIYEADSERTALDIIKNNDINMFLIDIGLKESSGLDLVFLTTHLDYMFQAFKRIHCYDYILKPYNKYDVQAMLDKLINKEINNLNNGKNNFNEEDTNKELVIKVRNSVFVRVKINDILFIEVTNKNCEVNTINGIYTYNRISLKKILDLISCDYIVQSHRSFAINKNYVFKIERLGIRLSEVYFKNYSKTALIGIKFKNNIIPEFKKAGKYYAD